MANRWRRPACGLWSLIPFRRARALWLWWVADFLQFRLASPTVFYAVLPWGTISRWVVCNLLPKLEWSSAQACCKVAGSRRSNICWRLVTLCHNLSTSTFRYPFSGEISYHSMYVFFLFVAFITLGNLLIRFGIFPPLHCFQTVSSKKKTRLTTTHDFIEFPTDESGTMVTLKLHK